MSNNSEPIQLGLLPDMDMPMRLLQPQRAAKAHKVKTQVQVRLGDATRKIALEAQSHPNPITDVKCQPDSEWERSQEFEITTGGQSVLVRFQAFYFYSSHHFEFRGETISSTGYRSDFFHVEQADQWRSPIEYATHKAQEFQAELLKEQKKWRRKSRLISQNA